MTQREKLIELVIDGNIDADESGANSRLERCEKVVDWLLANGVVVLPCKVGDAAVADLEKCMHYAEPKNNNVCNFCKKDMSEYPDKCDGWSDFCKCEPEWRGVQEGE